MISNSFKIIVREEVHGLDFLYCGYIFLSHRGQHVLKVHSSNWPNRLTNVRENQTLALCTYLGHTMSPRYFNFLLGVLYRKNRQDIDPNMTHSWSRYQVHLCSGVKKTSLLKKFKLIWRSEKEGRSYFLRC